MKKMQKCLWTLAVLLLGLPLQAQSDTKTERREFNLSGDQEFYLDIDIDAGDVRVQPAGHDSRLVIELRFTDGYFDHAIEYNERNRRVRISFERKRWLNKDEDDLDAEIDILLPSRAILDFNARIKAGKVDTRLGDLSLKRLDLKTWAGEVRVDFDRPNRIAMSSLYINTKVGETEIRRLGNARFQFADIDAGVGALRVDFSGELGRETTAQIDLDIGETNITLPEKLGIKLEVDEFLFLSKVHVPWEFKKSGRYYLSENYDKAEKTLELKIKPGIGELRIDIK